MKKLLLISLTLLVITGIILSGCAKAPAPAPAPTPTPAPAPAPAPAPVKPIKLIFGFFGPEQDAYAAGFKFWADDLKARSNGKVEVEFSWASALGPAPTFYDMVLKGVCDIACVAPGFTPGLFPMADIPTMPWTAVTSEQCAKASSNLLKKGYLDKELADVKPLFITNSPGEVLLTVSKPVTTLKDMQGEKLELSRPMLQNRMSLMGAVPVKFPGPMDIYPALQKGIVDGSVTNIAVASSLKWMDFIKYATEPPMGAGMMFVVMGKGSYNKLPADIKAIIDEMSGKDIDKYILYEAKNLDGLNDSLTKSFLASGGRIVQWTPDTLAKMNELFAPQWKAWLADSDAKGLPMSKAVSEHYRFMKEDLGISNPAIGYTP